MNSNYFDLPNRLRQVGSWSLGFRNAGVLNIELQSGGILVVPPLAGEEARIVALERGIGIAEDGDRLVPLRVSIEEAEDGSLSMAIRKANLSGGRQVVDSSIIRKITAPTGRRRSRVRTHELHRLRGLMEIQQPISRESRTANRIGSWEVPTHRRRVISDGVPAASRFAWQGASSIILPDATVLGLGRDVI